MTKDTFPMNIGGGKVRSERILLAKVENGKNMMSADSVRFLVLHCSASRCNEDYSVEQLRRDHKARGFYDIGYHFYIRKDGTMTQHRMLLEVGAHARPYNRCSIGICYEGGLDEQGKPYNTMTTEQETRLIDLFRNLKILFPKAKIVGHRDLPGTTPKECPCLDAGSWAAHHHLD
ncbi:N-acetylmuramoyl-L-alanine amidase [Prevotella copri]|uniref:N-acetylmuramoyl-L-alanine amidase n=1 Tax=Segatella copri TaxID=165179 RepID=A0A6I2TZ25_9BACT|nr:N-acetylmuramoyl-L-alanine amidase [Segatella copri]MST78605.1 N-acetylmuramoyl-L-alanine amidase [Segatella copri]